MSRIEQLISEIEDILTAASLRRCPKARSL